MLAVLSARVERTLLSAALAFDLAFVLASDLVHAADPANSIHFVILSGVEGPLPPGD
jgi:hypothetical protein